MKQIFQTFGWAILAFLCFFLGIKTFEYFSFRTDVNFLLAKQYLVSDVAWMTAFYIHISSAILVILIGPLQFLPFIRRRYTAQHRFMGKVYVSCILFLAAPSGLYMSFFANGGIWASIGFGVLSVLWFVATYRAFYHIRRREVEEHRNWMLRSYALTLSAVMLRVYVPVLSMGFGVDHHFTVVITSWINWIPNLIIVELFFIRRAPLLPGKVAGNNNL